MLPDFKDLLGLVAPVKGVSSTATLVPEFAEDGLNHFIMEVIICMLLGNRLPRGALRGVGKVVVVVH